jgi:hypothetical protein
MADVADCKAATTPMEERLRMSHDSKVEEVDATQYWRIVGSLWYLVHTHPDLAYVVGYVSHFLQIVKRMLHYIVGTLEFGLCYGGVLEQQGCWATVTATLSTISV